MRHAVVRLNAPGHFRLTGAEGFGHSGWQGRHNLDAATTTAILPQPTLTAGRDSSGRLFEGYMVTGLPTLHTERLTLRSFDASDAPAVQRLAGDRLIAATTMNIPHPYDLKMAQEWIATHEDDWLQERAAHFAIASHVEGGLIGAVGLRLKLEHSTAELGYWIGKPYWGNGYATEAAKATVAFGFNDLRLNRIHARHFGGNPASGRVLQKTGMQYEGCLRQHVRKLGTIDDVELYGIIASEWRATHAKA
jgi:RimJ/RimL family protein N-acetyltransferase